MEYQTLLVATVPHGLTITFNRLERRNSLNSILLQEMHQVFDLAEKDPTCRIIIIKGQQGLFCTGMDFHEITQFTAQSTSMTEWAAQYMRLLKRIALMAKVVIAEINGQVMAGGIGIVAASDIVIATPASQFSLSEALWGLLPANVLPYLIRRIGFQKAYFMTLTTQTFSAANALAMNLVDEVSENTEEVLRKHMLRVSRLDEQTLLDMKNYFRHLWIINEEMENLAINEITRLVQQPRVKNNIKNFIEHGKFPWETVHE